MFPDYCTNAFKIVGHTCDIGQSIYMYPRFFVIGSVFFMISDLKMFLLNAEHSNCSG